MICLDIGSIVLQAGYHKTPRCRVVELMEACGGDLWRTRETLQILLHIGYLERRQQDGDVVYVTTAVSHGYSHQNGMNLQGADWPQGTAPSPLLPPRQ